MVLGRFAVGFIVKRPQSFQMGLRARWVLPRFAVRFYRRNGRAAAVVVARAVGSLRFVHVVEGTVVDGRFGSECCGSHCRKGDCGGGRAVREGGD